ncbi:hypothetical protein WH52_00850 [Tenacibaculum holothuriorum]|uniref:YdhG-like domain-containing protein n=1 Tax=Tenacibaculum holothuriorum TaxID=1635173 RepID=A0A1Y2PHG6_9FLAO|nr:YdeI/OmpD-associated family protein [Tenacibaculum holothuriorum]OSY89227.1 hypothetical protein WH52_00850 [Tenacibaculum holothuriorum]
MNKKVTEYINSKEKWAQELQVLRSILLKLPLEEAIKWSAPAYLYKGKNILGIAAFKNYFGLWFHQGVFLKDEAKVLMNAQEGKTKAMRQWRFESLADLNEELVKQYVLEAIDNEEKGLSIKPKRNTKPVVIPKELQDALDNNQKLKDQFEAFSLSKKREYAEHIASAKREATKQNRLQKIIPMILDGKGLHDKYKNC